MSYVVLARKYRPRNFAEMVGQSHVVQALSNALGSQRLHHAYLFTGTRGVGKTTVSRILAKSLNCLGADGQGGITAEPCGVCRACTDIDAGRFVDYTELDAASNRGVDEVQSLLEQAVYKPVQGRFKVFMIDEVHMLTGHAFNAMLKTLEEPPEYLKFVLATTDPQKVPVTVLSRCLQFNLRPMAPETVLDHLAQVLQAEQVPAEPLALRLIARAARGSMRDALSLTDQAIAFGGGQLQEATVRQMLGAVDRSYVLRLLGALAAGDGATVVDTIDSLRSNGLNAASALEEMTGLLQRMAVLQAVPGRAAAPADAGDPDAAEIQRLAQTMPADETQLLYSLCLHGRAELGLAPDEYAALTMVLLRLLAFQPGATANSATPEKKTLKSPAEAQRQPPPSPPGANPASPPGPTPASLQGLTPASQQGDTAASLQGVTAASPPADRNPTPLHAGVLATEPVAPTAGLRDVAPPADLKANTAATSARATASAAASTTRAETSGPLASAAAGAVSLASGDAPAVAIHPAAPSPQPAPSLNASLPHPQTPAARPPGGQTQRRTWAPSEAGALDDGGPPWIDEPDEAAPDARRETPSRVLSIPVREQVLSPRLEQLRDPHEPIQLPEPSRSAEGDFWFDAVQQLLRAEAVTALVRELALQSQLVARDADQWLLRIERESLNQGPTRERLATALQTLGHAVRLVVEIAPVSDSAALRLAAEAAQRQREAERIMLEDPFVQAMVRDFGGKIVPGTLKAAPG